MLPNPPAAAKIQFRLQTPRSTMLRFSFRSRVRRPPLLPRAAAIPRRRNRAEHRRHRRLLDSDVRLRSFAGPSRREMDPPNRPPSRGTDDTTESAAAAPPPSGAGQHQGRATKQSPSQRCCCREAGNFSNRVRSRGIKAAPQKNARGPCRRRRRPRGVVDQAFSFRRKKRGAPTGDRNPDISAAAASRDSSTKSYHHSSSSGEAAAAGGDGYSIKIAARYKKIVVLGEGGCGTVWKARDTRTGELVAIKSGKKAEDGAALLREAALLAACRGNPAVVGFREVVRGPGADDVHLVMDLVGPSLRDLLNARGRMTEPETRGAMRQLLAGVDMMGKQGVVHGDLKPENVLLVLGNRNDRVKFIICDLGLAVSLSALPCHIEGTLYYSAPEQLLGEKNCGLPVDPWALGCVMVELLTGQPLVQAYPPHPAVQLARTLQLLGVPDEVTQMENGVDASMPSQLRDTVREDLLTQAGFDVLNGLLQYNSQDRLTPAAALQMPWFAEEEQP